MEVESVITDNLWLWVAALVLCLPLRTKVAEKADRLVASSGSAFGAYTLQFSRAIIAIVILTVSVALLVGATNNAFIYTRF